MKLRDTKIKMTDKEKDIIGNMEIGYSAGTVQNPFSGELVFLKDKGAVDIYLTMMHIQKELWDKESANKYTPEEEAKMQAAFHACKRVFGRNWAAEYVILLG